MSVLEGLLIAEALLLACGGILLLIGKAVKLANPEDPLHDMMLAFWRGFRYPYRSARSYTPQAVEQYTPRSKMAASASSDEDSDVDYRLLFPPEIDREDDAKPGWTPGQNLSDSFYGRIKKSADGTVQTATLLVKVTPYAADDSVMGRYGNVVKIQVVDAAETGKANKTVIALVAQTLEIRPFQVQMSRGHYQQRKVLQIAGMEQSELDSRLSMFG